MRNYPLKFLFIAIFAICFRAPLLPAASSSAPAATPALFARSHTLSNLEAAGSPPFSLSASITVYPQAQSHMQGNYQLSWASPGKWRRESSFPGYHEISVGEGNKVWHLSNVPYRPYYAFQASHALSFFTRLSPPPDARLLKVRFLTPKGTPLSCAELQTKNLKRQNFCFNPSTGYLVRESDSEWLTTYEYQDYFLTDGRAFPRTIRVFQKGRLILQARVTELALNSSIRPALFRPPAGPHLRSAPACNGEALTDPRKISGGEAQYPEGALHSKEQGSVQLYADIGADGRVRGLSVLESPGSDFSRAATQAVSHWSFAPARCGGVPVETTIAIIIHFHVR